MNTDDRVAVEHDADGYALIGACFEVYNEMGNGYLEDVYQESLELELLKSTGRRVGYLVNFGGFPKLDWRRRVR